MSGKTSRVTPKNPNLEGHCRDQLSRLVTSLLLFVCSLPASGSEWQVALPGWRPEFPRDHGSHPGFKTEWWYFTGNLFDSEGRRFGYQLTFFRQGLRPPAQRGAETSRFVVDDMKLAHFALTDLRENHFRFQQKLSRGAFGEAGFDQRSGNEHRLAWLDSWSVQMDDASRFRFKANTGDAELALVASLAKPFVIHGQNGVSQKAEGAGHASHYYSATRLATTGTLKIKGQEIEVKGESWLDREWASNQLTSEQVGWDWFSVQFDDGTELMLYQMRRRDGSVDLASSGTWIPADGEATHLSRDACRLRPLEHWKSTATAGRYPVAWDVEVPSLQLRVRVTTPMKEQELALKPIAYWEGMIDASGARAGKPLRGRGYMELTGYAGALVGLSSGSR